MSPGYAIASFVQSILEGSIPFIGILLSKFIIDELIGAKRITSLFYYVIIASVVTLLFSVLSNALKRYMKVETRNIMVKFEIEMGCHNMGVAYENLEDAKYIELKNSAMMPIRGRLTLLFMIRYIPDMIRYVVVAIVAIGIMVRFDIMSLVIVLIPTFFITWLNQNYQKKDLIIQKETVKTERPFMYFFNLMSEFGSAKDIRLFSFQNLLMKRNNECHDMILGFKKRSGKLRYQFEGISKVLEGFRSAAIYGYIGLKSAMLNVGIGNFVLYIGVANTFSVSVSKLLEVIITLRQDCRYLDDYVKLEEIPLEKDVDGITDFDVSDVNIEFRGVSFRYPGSTVDVLRNVNFYINSKETISIVGQNGAGKTTIIKLLSRIFKPTEGVILMNGIDIQSIDSTVYRKNVSVVFQDFKMLQVSITENVTAGEAVDEERLILALAMSGLGDKIASLECGINTPVGKQFDANGTEFSGGELQKLAIARSLYKNTPVIVLDEPTAALDPYAEEEIYIGFNKLTRGRLAIYISHRLSSCKFCDRILYLDQGKIVEDGNHDELMNDKGKYAEMFMIQANQYIS
jgi:ABC-type multidrug transport system fused ATPase/permease subunit